MAWDSTWDDVFERSEWGKYPSESLIRFVARNYYQTNRSKIRILELGCGPGANIWYLARENFRTFGIDGSAIAIANAKKRLAGEKLSADLRVGDIATLPYKDGYFDAVVEVVCLSCNSLDDSRSILAEAHRVLKPSGKLFSLCFSVGTSVGRAKSIGNLSYKNIKTGPIADLGFVRLTDKRTARRLYGEHFRITSLDTLDFTTGSGAHTVSHLVIAADRKR